LLALEWMRKAINAVLVLALAAACSRHDEQISVTSAKMDAAPHDSDAIAAARRWDAAMSQRDLSRLSNVYGVHVDFHGVPLRHDQVLQALGDMFVKDPSFTQSISDVWTPAAEHVELERASVIAGKPRRDSVRLELARQDGALVVVRQSGESDDAKDERCEALAERVVMSTDRARALTNDPRNEVRLVMAPPAWPAYVVVVIDRTTRRTVTIGWFDVVPETGEISEVFGGETLNPDATSVAQLRSCPD